MWNQRASLDLFFLLCVSRFCDSPTRVCGFWIGKMGKVRSISSYRPSGLHGLLGKKVLCTFLRIRVDWELKLLVATLMTSVVLFLLGLLRLEHACWL